ncbi:unnamed protein product [Spirodela intermedia]|uniref:Uncharacterized protein n=1 Tax=Spirodela intermedia TaxID=51605 RepID=A0A7I8L5A0_SPIIN|nr:unnamed protein product [Spirodela intermedia]
MENLKSVLFSVSSGAVDGLPPGDELQQHNTEAVDVRLDCQLPGHGILGSTVAISSHDSG